MKILLIGVNSKYIHPAVGIHQIVANSVFAVDYLEFSIKDNNQSILDRIEKDTYQLIGFSVYIWNIEKIKALINAYSKKTIFLLGGPEASYRPELLNYDQRIRYIIKGEGEEAFNELIEYLNQKRKIADVSNLYYLNQGKLTYTYTKSPNLSKVKHDLSLSKDLKNRVCYLEASRGCPFKCSYCLSSIDNQVRFFGLNNVLKEISFALENNLKVVKFLDRTFNLKQTEMRKILSFIKENDNHYTTFQFEIVGDLLEEDTINLLKTIRPGQIRFEIGVQSTNEIVTKAVRRKQNFSKLKANVLNIKEQITIHLDLIAGLPYEDKDSFINTFNETFLIFPHELQLGFLKELQGTEISKRKDIHNYQFSPFPPYEIESNLYLSKDDLEEIKTVEATLNKYYNTNNFPKTMKYLFQELKLDPYLTFLKIGNMIKISNLKSMQPNSVALNLYESLEDLDREKLLFLIKQDYLLKTIRPKIWWERKISRGERKTIYHEFVKAYPNLDYETLYRYSHLERYKNEYYLITYKPIQEYFLKMPI